MKRVLIIGANGQDGTLLTGLLNEQKIEHLGVNRQGAFSSSGKLIQSGTLADPSFIEGVVKSFSPTHIFYLAAHHHSSEQSEKHGDATLWSLSLEVQVLGLAHTLQALKANAPGAKLFYASSSHIYGSPVESPQNEISAKVPINVYGLTKVAGMEVCRHYRERYGLFASVGILYNHESVHRKQAFLSKKVIQATLAIKKGRLKRLTLGDLSTEVDWGYAPDYVDAMIRILDFDRPDNFVIASGEGHSVREFVQIAFAQQELDYREWVEEDASFIHGSTSRLVGDSSKLRGETGWTPTVSFAEMIGIIARQTKEQDKEADE